MKGKRCYVCLSLPVRDEDHLKKLPDHIRTAVPDATELRLDYWWKHEKEKVGISEFSGKFREFFLFLRKVEKTVEDIPIPILYTLRTKNESGYFFHGPKEYTEALGRILTLCRPNDMIDMEFQSIPGPSEVERWIRRLTENWGITRESFPTPSFPSAVVLSRHTLGGIGDRESAVNTAAEMGRTAKVLSEALRKIIKECRKTHKEYEYDEKEGPEIIIKVVWTAEEKDDVDRLENMLKDLDRACGFPRTFFLMGEKGAGSRIRSCRWGNRLVFAPPEGELTAPGQLNINNLKELLEKPV